MNATPNPRFDPVALEILWSRLISIADESAAVLLRTAFSTVVRESNDFTTVLLDAECNCLAENTGGIPSFVGMVPSTVKAMLERIPVERWRPGDCIITNDPWLGSGHLPDVTMASPIFHRGRLVGFSGSIAHLPDIGGSGWACDTRELYEEGLRLMPVKFIENDEEHPIVGDIIRANVRVPDQVVGDLYAQVAAQRICRRGLQNFLDDTGLADLAELSAELRGRAETAMRKAIAALPDGSWSASMDADGIDELETHIECRMTVCGSDLELDFEGTSEQVACGINSVMKYTYAYATYPIKCALDPDSPRNEGSFQPITVRAPEGSILNPTRPAPVGARQPHGTSPVRRHLSVSRPGRAGPGRRGVRQHPQPALRLRRRGPAGQPVQPGAVRIRREWAQATGRTDTPAPPFLPIPAWAASRRWRACRRCWCGARSWRGIRAGPGSSAADLGQDVEIEVRSDRPVRLSVMSDRHKYPPRGILGGRDGSRTRIEFRDGTRPHQKGRTADAARRAAAGCTFPAAEGTATRRSATRPRSRMTSPRVTSRWRRSGPCTATRTELPDDA